MTENVDALVLATVNAPYRDKVDAQKIVGILKEPPLAKEAAGPMSSFFYEVWPDLQKEFAEYHGLSFEQLAQAAEYFDKWSGKSWPAKAA